MRRIEKWRVQCNEVIPFLNNGHIEYIKKH